MAQSVDEQLVVVSQVHAYDGKPVKNLKSLASMVESCEELLKFDLEHEQIVVLQTQKAKAATKDIHFWPCIVSLQPCPMI